MPYIFVFILIFISSGLIYMNQRLKKSNKEHIQKIEQLRIQVVELAEKQLVLTEKQRLEGRLKIICNRSSEKLNKEVYGLFDLLMKMTDTKDQK